MAHSRGKRLGHDAPQLHHNRAADMGAMRGCDVAGAIGESMSKTKIPKRLFVVSIGNNGLVCDRDEEMVIRSNVSVDETRAVVAVYSLVSYSKRVISTIVEDAK
jgi:hypothetical protein